MSMNAGPNSSAEQVQRVLPVLLGALLMGMTSFAVIAVVLGPGFAAGGTAGGGAGGAPGGAAGAGGTGTAAVGSGPDANLLLMVMGGFSVFATVIYLVFGKLAQSQARAAYAGAGGDAEAGRNRVAQVLMTTTVLRAAVCEGAGLLGAVIVLLSGNMLGLAGVGFAAVMIGSLLPVRGRFESLLREASGAGGGMGGGAWSRNG